MPETTVTVDALSAFEAFQSQIGTPFIVLLFGVPLILFITAIRSPRMVALRRLLRVRGTILLSYIAAFAWVIQALGVYEAQVFEATSELASQIEVTEVKTSMGKELLHRPDLFCFPSSDTPTTVPVRGYLVDGKTEFTGVVTRGSEAAGSCTISLSIDI